MTVDSIDRAGNGHPPTVELPSSTVWPIVLALGVTLLAAGLVTAPSISILGALLAVCGGVGWFRDVLPHEKHESVPTLDKVPSVVTTRQQVARIAWVNLELRRAHLPLEIYPVSAGVKGGLVGSAVMAVLACTYGIVTQRGIWYPINLLSAGFLPGMDTIPQLSQFHWSSFILAVVLHLFVSLLVGLLYGTILPMLPRHPILLGGLFAPIVWTGLLHSSLELINPVLNHHIDWFWFVLSQIGFGIAAGIVVSRQEQVHTWQHLPLGVRAGIETPGAMREERNDGSGGSQSR